MSSFRTMRSGTVNTTAAVDVNWPLLGGSEALMDCLFGYLSDDGKKKMKPCKLSVFVEEGNVKVCVRDEEYGRSAFAVLDPFKTFGEALIEVLDSGTLSWHSTRGRTK